MTYQEIVREVSKKLNLPPDVVRHAYSLYWKFIKTTIEELPLKDDLTRDEFDQLRTSFNLPYLGKLHCTYNKWQKQKTKFQYAKSKKDKANVHCVDNNHGHL